MCPPWVNVRPGEAIHLVFPADRREQTVDVSGRVVWKRLGGDDPAAEAIGAPAVPWRIGVALHLDSRPEALRLLDQ